ncbi:MAG: NUDIX domain-containing protein [Caldilineales bacterium]
MARTHHGNPLGVHDVAVLSDRWRPVVQPRAKHEEPFDLVDMAGDCTGVAAPRWLCHLLGLCHRTVHLALHAPQGWLVLQVRSRRVDWPGLIDLSVTGHVRAGLSWEEAMHCEATEELGVDLDPAAGMVEPPGAVAIGQPYHRSEADSHNPPVHICHVTQVFTATLTSAGLAGLHFSDGEVVGLYLASFDEVNRMVEETPDRLAPGLVQSWPHYAAVFNG